MVLVVVPYLSRKADLPGWRKPVEEPARVPGLRVFRWFQPGFARLSQSLLTPAGDAPRTVFHAVPWVVIRYAKNLLTVILISLPLMILAGLFGAALVELLPWTRVAEIAQVDGLFANATVILIVAAFGTLLPIPIAFDVVVCAVLWNAGVPMYVVATLLVTLPIYSVYAASLIGTTLSWRIAALAGAAVLMLGIVAGGAADLVFRWEDVKTVHQASALLASIPAPAGRPAVIPQGKSAADLRGLAPPLPAATKIWAEKNLELSGAPFLPPSAASGKRSFARVD